MAWSIDDVPDQSGRTAVVTGANGGLGLETAEVLAGRGAHVVMAVRDRAKADEARSRILTTHPDASLELIALDLASQSSVRAAAQAIADAHPVLDLLVNNAGVMATPEWRTDDGYEMQFGVNHLGHWTFTADLLPTLLRSDLQGRQPRVVTVTSIARFNGRAVDPDNPHLEGRYSAWGAYGQSKLANYHFGIGLQRRFERAETGAASLLAHPGLSNTDLQARTKREGGAGTSGALGESAASAIGMSAAAGARMQLRAATDPAAKGGQLYAPLFGSNGPPVRRPILRSFDLDTRIRQLWEVSERETGVALDVAAAKSTL